MPVGWHKSGKLSSATGVMMKGHRLWNLAEMTPLPGTSFVALSKHISQVFFGCQGQKPNSNWLTLSYLSTETRKLRGRLASGMAGCRRPGSLLESICGTGALWVRMS